MSGKGTFITFEGIEGCGKSSQARMALDLLKKRGVDAVLTREPGGTIVGDALREMLLSRENGALAPMTELLLYMACRAQHVHEIVRPALEAGKTVLCDRFSDSTLAYQGYGRGLPRKFIAEVNLKAADGLVPDLTILLDCDPAVGLGRVRTRYLGVEGGRVDRLEAEELSFHDRIRQGFLEIGRSKPSRFAIIDASGPEAEIAAEVSRVLLRRLGLEAGD